MTVKIIRVSYSEIKDARQCSMKHELGWRYGWRREHIKTCDCALCFGIAWHEILNAYYTGLKGGYKSEVLTLDRNGTHSMRGGWHAGRDKLKQQPEHLQARLEWMLEGYAAHYGNEKGWTVLATEKEFIVPLPQLYDDLFVELKVIIDLIIRDPNGKIWVDDHKTCARFPAEKRQTDAQLPLYMYALRETNGWGTPFGARYSYAKKPYVKKDGDITFWELKDRFRRRLKAHTDKELTTAALDAYTTTYTRYREAELFSVPPRSVGPDCSSFCDYETPCLASRKGYALHPFLRDTGYKARHGDEPKQPKEKEAEEG